VLGIWHLRLNKKKKCKKEKVDVPRRVEVHDRSKEKAKKDHELKINAGTGWRKTTKQAN